MPALPPGQALNRLASVPVVRLAMEPTADRSDEREGRIFTAVDHKPPQWSRPWNGRMTSNLMSPSLVTLQPQWSRPWNGRMTVAIPEARIRVPEPQWSRPWNGRMTCPGCPDIDRGGRAAMEPTVERSDDSTREQPFLTASSAAMEPTVERSDDQDANPVVMDIVLPQWSRPWNGRMTRRTQASSDGSGSAAMEPTVERSDDQGCPAHRVPAGTGRNGADRGTVG